MSNQVQRRRGTTAEHASFTGALGEVTVDTTKKVLVVHDGASAGGFPLARADQVPTGSGSSTGTNTGDQTITLSGDASGSGTGSLAVTLATVPIAKGGTGQTSSVAALDALAVQGTNIASASTTDLSTATGYFVNITGSTTITALGTVAAGVLRFMRFSGAPLLTHNAASLILPGNANIQAAAGDVAIVVSLGSGNWRCANYMRLTAPPVSGSNTGDQTINLTGDVSAGGTGSMSVTVLQASQAFALTGVFSPAQITADQNDYNPTNLSTATTLRINADAPRSITGLQGGAVGRMITFVNLTVIPITFTDEDSNSTAANRFAISTGNCVLGFDECVSFQYDSTSSRWRMQGTAVPNASIVYGHIQNVSATSRLLGRKTAGAGSIEEINAGSATDRASVGLGNMAVVDNPIQTGKVLQLVKEQGTTTLYPIGMGAPTETNAGSSVDGSMFGVKRYITTSTSDDTAGLITPDLFRSGYNADCLLVAFVGNTITNYRFWAAATSATLGAIGAPTTVHLAGFRYDTSVDGTAFWRCVTCDGSTATTTTTSIAIASATAYTFRIKFVASAGTVSDIYFYIDGVEAAHHTTNLPGGSTNLKLQFVCSNVSVAATRRLDFSRFGVLIP